ncbi:LamG-like jellyroll fold domain-containing protein [Pedobacter steynii]|uniref:LamG-like jellyroll fold domain-containing protein n=1 Tax=Pedobacter steynii TaxID=430522 RepID=A0A1D7QN72_9SPHI|nr:LamG-like jellyroll fold domain-containing protein [Pedobacter steynii]AOM80104.1 hypothetical protein BFS30_24835 [Pedobacter steynii]
MTLNLKSVIYLSVFLLLIFSSRIYGQDKAFATSQSNVVLQPCSQCSIQNPDGAVGIEDTSYSTLSLGGATPGTGIKQTLIFDESAPASIAKVVIRIGNGNALTPELQQDIRIQSFLGNVANNDTTTVANLIGLFESDSLNADIEFFPHKEFDRVEIYLRSEQINAFSNFRIYHAYKLIEVIYAAGETHNVQFPCGLCSVENPAGALGSNSADYSSLVLGTSLIGGSVKQKLIFPDTADGTTSKVTLRVGNAQGLFIRLLGNVTVESFLGNVANNDKRKIDSLSISINTDSTLGSIEFIPGNTFDRIEISLNGGLIGLFGAFRIYYAYYTLPPFSECATIPTTPLAYYRFDNNFRDEISQVDIYTNLGSRFDGDGICSKSMIPENVAVYHFPFTNMNERSFAVWCETDSTDSQRMLQMNGGDFLFSDTITEGVHNLHLSQANSAGLKIQYTFNSPGPIHVVGTFDGDSTKLYVNGVFVGKTGKGPLQSSTNATFVGNAVAIDELFFYDRALTQEEISAFYQSYPDTSGQTNSFALRKGIEKRADINAPICESLTLSPNPTTGKVIITTNRYIKHANISVINIAGQLLSEQKELEGNKFYLDISAYPAGVYIVALHKAGKSLRIKLLKY